jgi:hypothetical protein
VCQTIHQKMFMQKLDMYNSSVWVKLYPEALDALTKRCKEIADFFKDPTMEKVQMERFVREDGWYEFAPADLVSVFGELISNKGGPVPFENNEIVLEKPY